MKSLPTIFFSFSLCFIHCSNQSEKQDNEEYKHASAEFEPYQKNPRYWQYKGKPVLLLGATDNDNLFQISHLKEHLDALREAGGNYIRNTMSSRDSLDLWPFFMREDGMYDLNQWNDDYWSKFESLLRLTSERDIIVQIEVWDRFDFSREPWQLNPFNPAININYTAEEVNIDTDYPKHPSTDMQPFFHSIPGMPLYDSLLDKVRGFQEALVAKMLSYTLEYGNVLYCMNNETSTPVEWGNYWIDFIRTRANNQGKEVYLTDMYDQFFKPGECENCRNLIANPYYTFIDVSQNNSRNFNQNHWDTLQWILAEREKYAPKPVNNTKIYGGNNSSWGSGSNEDGIERMCRNIIGGCASSRHHRPPSGNGLNDKARACIGAIRKVETLVQFWEVSPHMELLGEREDDEAYLTAAPGSKYVVYFTKGGNVTLDLTSFKEDFSLSWIGVSTGEWGHKEILKGGENIILSAPDTTGWFCVVYKST